jgi:iron complex outermembrane receptor protein
MLLFEGIRMSKILTVCAFLLVFCLPAPLPLRAQDAAGGAGGAAEDDLEILVTASRVEEEASEAAASVTVLSAEDLRAPGNLTLADALENVAGLQFRSYSGNAAQAVASMRGFSENSHGRVLVLIDGRRLNMVDMRAPNWLQIPLERVERVEVVRGGSTALYGDNALGGVINVITRRGAEELEVELSGSGGSFAAHREGVSVRGALGDRLRYSLSGQYGATEGYRERSGYASAGGAAGLELDISDRLAGSLSFSYDRLGYEMPGALTEAQVAADPTQAGNPADETEEQYLNAGLTLAFQTPAGLLETDLVYGWKLFATDMTSWLSFTDRTYHSAGLSPRFSGEYRLGGMAGRFVAGADLGLDLLSFESYSSADRTALSRAADINRVDLGVYVSDDLEVRQNLTASAGLRYEAARLAIRGSELVTLDEDVLHQVLAASASLLFHVAEGHKAYIRYERVYRLPFADEQISYQGLGADAFFSDLEPEKGHNVELGSDLALSSGLGAAASLYVLAMTDEIAWNGAASRNENLDKTLHYGGEVALSARLGPTLRLSGSYSYTRAFYLDGPYEGKELVLVANHAASGEAGLELLPGLTAGAKVSYVGEMYKDWDTGNEGEPLAGYALCDLSLSFRHQTAGGSLELSAGVSNVFDLSYSTWAQYGFGFGDSYYPAPGRSWTAGGSYRY